MLRIWVLAAVVGCAAQLFVGCAVSTPTHPMARYYKFHSMWPADVDRAWDAAITAVSARHKTRVVDRTHGIIITWPEIVDSREPSLTVEYFVQLRNTYAMFRHARTDTPAGLALVVTPLAIENGHVLPNERIPRAAEDHRDELLGAVQESIWSSGAVH